jgi:hypothetical protein
MQKVRRTVVAWLGLAVLVSAFIVPATVSADTFTSWSPGPGAVLDNTYDGYIDTPRMNATVPTGSFPVSGWFVDRQAQGWAGADDVQIWLGLMGSGGKLLTKANFALPRPDVAAATNNPWALYSGFGAVVPAGSVPAGTQVLSVYAHTPGKGWWYKQVQVNVSATAAAATSGATAPAAGVVSGGALPIVGIDKPKDGENVPTKNDYTIIGYALDKNALPGQGVAGSGINRVEVWLGEKEAQGSKFLGEAELGYGSESAAAYGSQFASSGWRLTFKPTQFKANSYVIFAYAHSVVTGKEDVATRYFVIKE